MTLTNTISTTQFMALTRYLHYNICLQLFYELVWFFPAYIWVLMELSLNIKSPLNQTHSTMPYPPLNQAHSIIHPLVKFQTRWIPNIYTWQVHKESFKEYLPISYMVETTKAKYLAAIIYIRRYKNVNIFKNSWWKKLTSKKERYQVRQKNPN